jgi:methionyl-tRNA synthetase
MGNDENSLHIVTAAQQNGVSPAEWTDRMEVAFKRAWTALDISVDRFVRTTEPRHGRAAQELFRRAQAKGDVYKAVYAGFYCPNCNNYYTADELVDGRCPQHPSLTPEWLEEENYFFALSRYTDRLLALFEENPDFVTPTVWRPEMMALLQQGLRDFSVSRQVRPGAEPWGVPVPGDPNHVLYVWFDALTTYITAIGFPDDEATFDRYWPAEAQLIGKDIQRFHCLYWPAMLLSAGLQPPQRIVVHGFMTLEGKKISKTAGNVLDPVDAVEEFGTDAVRYYLTRDFTFRGDGDFSRANLIRRYNDDLANDLGNLLNRVVAMIDRYRAGAVPVPATPGDLEEDLRALAERVWRETNAAIDRWELDGALTAIWTLIRRANQYLEERAPWRLAKQSEETERLDTVLWTAAEATRQAALLLAPFLPGSCDKIVAQLGLPPIQPGAWATQAGWGSVPLGRVSPGVPVFPRFEG